MSWRRALKLFSLVLGTGVLSAAAFPASWTFLGIAGSDLYLAPGAIAVSWLPEAAVASLEGDPEAGHGTFAIVLFAFLAWWLLLLATFLGVQLCRSRRTPNNSSKPTPLRGAA